MMSSRALAGVRISLATVAVGLAHAATAHADGIAIDVARPTERTKYSAAGNVTSLDHAGATPRIHCTGVLIHRRAVLVSGTCAAEIRALRGGSGPAMGLRFSNLRSAKVSKDSVYLGYELLPDPRYFGPPPDSTHPEIAHSFAVFTVEQDTPPSFTTVASLAPPSKRAGARYYTLDAIISSGKNANPLDVIRHVIMRGQATSGSLPWTLSTRPGGGDLCTMTPAGGLLLGWHPIEPIVVGVLQANETGRRCPANFEQRQGLMLTDGIINDIRKYISGIPSKS